MLGHHSDRGLSKTKISACFKCPKSCPYRYSFEKPNQRKSHIKAVTEWMLQKEESLNYFHNGA